VGQIIEKAEWFQRLPLEDATVPIQALTDAVVVASDTASPSNVLGTALRLCDVRISQFRCICSIYNPILFFAYKTMLNFGVEAEAILDWGSYVKANQDPKPNSLLAPDTAITSRSISKTLIRSASDCMMIEKLQSERTMNTGRENTSL
jgi:hypothetical protein